MTSSGSQTPSESLFNPMYFYSIQNLTKSFVWNLHHWIPLHQFFCMCTYVYILALCIYMYVHIHTCTHTDINITISYWHYRSIKVTSVIRHLSPQGVLASGKIWEQWCSYQPSPSSLPHTSTHHCYPLFQHTNVVLGYCTDPCRPCLKRTLLDQH